MVVQLIRLRFIQFYRGSGDLGIFRVLLLVVVLLPLIILMLVQRIAIHPWSVAIPGAALYILWLLHRRRRDYYFLTAILPKPQAIYLAEYFLFTLPITGLLLYNALLAHALVFSLGIFMITFFVPTLKASVSRTVKLSIVPAGMFEWQSGIRKNLIAVILFYIAGLFGYYQILLSAISLLFLTLIFVSFYSEYEPWHMMASGNTGSWKYLLQKTAKHAGCFAVFIFPLICIALIHEDYRWLILGYFMATLNLLTFTILLKYYQYRPGAFSGAHQMLTTLAVIVSVILPVALVILLFNLFLAAGASKNLKIYLDAHN